MIDRPSSNECIGLWDAFRSGSRDAFAQIYDLYATDLYRYGYNLVRNRQVVEDCLHELFLHIYENRTRLGATDNIRFYLYRALRRRLLSMVTQLNRLDSETYLFDKAEFLIASYEHSLIEEQSTEERKQLMLSELEKLTKRQKEILYLVYMKGLTYQQVSEVMDIAMKTVYNTINMALMTLRKNTREMASKRL